MDKIEAKKLVRAKLNGYKLQRSNEVFNNMGLYSFIDAFRVNSANIATLPNTVLSTGIIFSLLTASLYHQKKQAHELTRRINKLKEMETAVVNDDYVEDMTNEEFSKHLSLR